MTSRTLIKETLAAVLLAGVIFAPGILAQAPPNPLLALPEAIKATPGCLGVETAQTSSGKMVIFAWFENKKAVLNWYNSDMHQGLLNQYSAGHRRPGGPLAGVPDEGPVLAIASLTMPTPPTDGDLRAATTQIAIELYAPLPGGLASGGRFAPSSVKVPGLIEVPSARP